MKRNRWNVLAKRRMWPVELGTLALIVALVALVHQAQAAVVPPPAGSTPSSGIIVGHDSHHDTSPPLRDMPPVPPRAGQAPEAPGNPSLLLSGGHKDAPDAAVVQHFLAPPAMPTPILNFDGIAFTNHQPPESQRRRRGHPVHAAHQH